MKTAITSTKTPKPFLSFGAGTLALKGSPTARPSMAMKVNAIRKVQSITKAWVHDIPKKPISDLLAIINIDVPTAR